MLIEDQVLCEFDALAPSDRTPTALLSIVHRLYPNDAKAILQKSTSWRAIKGAAYALRLRSLVDDDGEAYYRRADLGACLESAVEIILAKKGKGRPPKLAKNSVSFCRYCWRLGNVTRERRGYNDNAKKVDGKTRRPDTHAYCSIHRPIPEKIVREDQKRGVRVLRKVLNRRLSRRPEQLRESLAVLRYAWFQRTDDCP
jgi:hypothetical protein